MLLGLTLRNFAIIDDISVGFGPGLNIITGETGAGKSIIIDALDVILGGKASADLIKTGKDEARIEALFDVSSSREITQALEEAGFDASGGELLIKRVISRKGRPRAFINGEMATLQVLENVTRDMIDIFSQHEHQTLLKEENHIKILDEAGGHGEAVFRTRELYTALRAVEKELKRLEEERSMLLQREDFLKFQCSEIDDALLQEGEDAVLEDEKKRLLNGERLISAAGGAYGELYESEPSVLGTLGRIAADLRSAGRIDPALNEAAGAVESAILQLKEGVFSLRDYVSGLTFEEGRLEVIEERLRVISNLRRKYGGTITGILEKREEMGRELNAIANYENETGRLNEEAASLRRELDAASRALSKMRKETAGKFSKTIEKELKEVGIKSARFVVSITDKEVSADGSDAVTFLFSANPDEEPRPLARVASGGELSRVLLVMKEAAAKTEGSVIIFDEADSGIGGAIAETVGRKISGLSRRCQVICITHLPQVAKFANSHLSVTKSVEGGKTKVEIKTLGQEERVRELARMIGGINITQKTLDAAHEMLGG